MKNENYINIQGWMINELKLKGNELVLYALIYGFCQDGQSEFHGSIRYIVKALGVSNPTVQKLLKKLVYKKVIHQTKESHYKVYKKVIQGVQESYTPGVQESYTNNNTTINKDNNISKDIGNKVSTKRTDIDDLLNKIQKIVGSLDDINKNNRNFAKNFIDSKMPKIYREELKINDFTKEQVINGILRIFQLAKKDKFHSKNCRKISYVYRNACSIMESNKVNQPKIAQIPKEIMDVLTQN